MAPPRPRDRDPRRSHHHHHHHQRDVKDRLIQTRVPERLESVLKEEAHKRRLTVSHLIRNMLEDTLNLVDTVVHEVGDIVGDSVDLAEQVRRDATKIASTAREVVRGRTPPETDAVPEPPSPPSPPPAEVAKEPENPDAAIARRLSALEHVLAWNQVVVHRPARCAGCDAELSRGSVAHLGLSQDAGAPPAWLCPACLERL